MSVLTLEGFVEGGQIRLTEPAVLPEKRKVYVVVPDISAERPRIRSPRLADPSRTSEFSLEMTELPETDAEL